MKLVIEIPEEYRSNFEDNRCKEKFDSLATNEFGYVLRKAFENGKPLPKGHGRIVDESKITKCEKVGIIIKDGSVIPCITTNAPTLIERSR